MEQMTPSPKWYIEVMCDLGTYPQIGRPGAGRVYLLGPGMHPPPCTIDNWGSVFLSGMCLSQK